MSTIVQSWNEWDPLREIVVGAADGACFEPADRLSGGRRHTAGRNLFQGEATRFAYLTNSRDHPHPSHA